MASFAPIPAGWFTMGSDEGYADERPRHRVRVEGFLMAVHPVTRAEYARFLHATGREDPREWRNPAFGAPDQPVVGVSWNDALAYCQWCTTEGDPVRLPTEAEWERAARGRREGVRYPWGNTIPGWIPDGGRGPRRGPWRVALGEPTDFGLYGIGANIHEWCADWHDRGYYALSPPRSPRGPATGVRRVSRGGSWRHAVTLSRTAARSKLDPSFRYTDYGFRVVRS